MSGKVLSSSKPTIRPLSSLLGSMLTQLRLARHIVVFLHIKLANRASWASLKQPLIDALPMEEVHAWQSAQFFSCFILNKTDHAFGRCLLFTLSAIVSNLLSCDLSHRQTLNDSFGGGLVHRWEAIFETGHVWMHKMMIATRELDVV